jgi:hypothetical protein
MELAKRLLVQVPGLPGVLTGAGRPIRVAQPLLQLGRLVVPLDRPLMRRQLALLGARVSLVGPVGGALRRQRGAGGVPDAVERPLDPTIGLPDAGPIRTIAWWDCSISRVTEARCSLTRWMSVPLGPGARDPGWSRRPTTTRRTSAGEPGRHLAAAAS